MIRAYACSSCYIRAVINFFKKKIASFTVRSFCSCASKTDRDYVWLAVGGRAERKWLASIFGKCMTHKCWF